MFTECRLTRVSQGLIILIREVRSRSAAFVVKDMVAIYMLIILLYSYNIYVIKIFINFKDNLQFLLNTSKGFVPGSFVLQEN